MSNKNETNDNIFSGSEDISALVVDLGFRTSKIGHNQEDTPKIFLDSICGEYINENVKNDNLENLKFPLNLYKKYEHIRIKPLFYDDNSIVHLNSDAFEKIIQYTIEGVEPKRVYEFDDEIHDMIKLNGLNLKLDEHPLLLSESNIHNHKIREIMTEILFEKYNIPALYFSKKAKLTSFSLGRSTSLVIDIGANSLNITSVYDGYVLQKTSYEYNIGGNYFDQLIYNELKKDNIKINPYFCEKNDIDSDLYKNVHPSYKEEAIMDVIRYFKESVCKICIDKNENDTKINGSNSIKKKEKTDENYYTEYEYKENTTSKDDYFELPDGNKISIAKYKYDIAEHLFKNTFFQNGFKGLPESVINCVISNDVDIRKDLLQSIILTGGSLFNGLPERLYNILREEDCFSQTAKLKVINTATIVENKFSSWLGGSILASLSTFQQLWISKKEYLESGHKIVLDKCF